MATTTSETEHTVFCPDNCTVRHNEMILALCTGNDDARRPVELTRLKLSLYSHLQNGWNAHSSVPDALPDFRFPLVHWACVLGKTRALNWLLTKMKFKAFVSAERTGESSLHRAIRLLYKVKSRDTTPRSVYYICRKFSHIVTTLTDQDPNGLFAKDKVQGNSCFHMCALCISQQDSLSSELEYYENCMKILIERAVFLQTTDKLPSTALRQALNSQNDRGETILHILARSNICRNTARFLLSDYKENINMLAKNYVGETALHVARDRHADLMVEQLDDSLGMESLVQSRPDVFQLYTQDLDVSSGQLALSVNSARVPECSSVAEKEDTDDAVEGVEGHFLRLNTLLPREGFYRGVSQELSSSEEESLSQTESVGSPSLLDTVSSENVTSSTRSDSVVTVNGDSPMRAAVSDSENSWSQTAIPRDVDTRVPTVCVPVYFENSVKVTIQDDETEDEEPNGAVEVLNVVVGEEARETALSDPTVDSRSGCKNVGTSTSDLPVPEKVNSSTIDSSYGEVLKVATSPLLEKRDSFSVGEESFSHNGEMSSSLAKIIRQESDMAKMVVARLQDKRELHRVGLRKAQKNLIEIKEKEGEAIREFQQLKVELDNTHAQEETLERRRQELLDELKGTERIMAELRENMIQLQARVDEKSRDVKDFQSDREKASEECNSLKRKLEEYSEALSEISPSSAECCRAKKERTDDD